jgi:hypothetical protein
VFRPLPLYEKVLEALEKGRITVAFNRWDGGADVMVPIDLTVSKTDDAGKRTKSQQMIMDFYSCTGDLMKVARASAGASK